MKKLFTLLLLSLSSLSYAQTADPGPSPDMPLSTWSTPANTNNDNMALQVPEAKEKNIADIKATELVKAFGSAVKIAANSITPVTPKMRGQEQLSH